MKLCLTMSLCFFSLLGAMEKTTGIRFLLPIEENEQWEHFDSDFHTIGLNDFANLKDEVGRLCKKPLRTISEELRIEPIQRTKSEGQIQLNADKLDCATIERQLLAECTQATQIHEAIGASNTLIATSMAREYYGTIRQRYKNAFNMLTISFSLKCYNSLEKLYQVLLAFVESESDVKQRFVDYTLDRECQTLYYSLLDIVENEKMRRNAPAKLLVPQTNTKDLLSALSEPQAQKAFHDGIAHRDAAQALFKNFYNPTFESLDAIEKIFFMAFESFITGFNRGNDTGLEEAAGVVQQLRKIHDIKLGTYKTKGARYPLAKSKLEEAKQLSLKQIREDAQSETSVSWGTILREEATEGPRDPRSENTESERAVIEQTPPTATALSLSSDSGSGLAPLSLLKSVASKTASGGKWVYHGCKKLWKKL